MDKRQIIIERCPVGFLAHRSPYELDDPIATGDTEEDAVTNLKELEG